MKQAVFWDVAPCRLTPHLHGAASQKTGFFILIFCSHLTEIGTGQVSIATRLRDGAPRSRVRFLAKARDFSFFSSIHMGSGTHPAFYPKGCGDCFSGELPRLGS
jgi:hypothetical protein